MIAVPQMHREAGCLRGARGSADVVKRAGKLSWRHANRVCNQRKEIHSDGCRTPASFSRKVTCEQTPSSAADIRARQPHVARREVLTTSVGAS
eukprot:159299-Pyramimonas_sp.AAC.1